MRNGLPLPEFSQPRVEQSSFAKSSWPQSNVILCARQPSSLANSCERLTSADGRRGGYSLEISNGKGCGMASRGDVAIEPGSAPAKRLAASSKRSIQRSAVRPRSSVWPSARAKNDSHTNRPRSAEQALYAQYSEFQIDYEKQRKRSFLATRSRPGRQGQFRGGPSDLDPRSRRFWPARTIAGDRHVSGHENSLGKKV